MSNIVKFPGHAPQSNASLLDAAIASTQQPGSFESLGLLNQVIDTTMFETQKHFGLTSAVLPQDYNGSTPSLAQWTKAADLDFHVESQKPKYTFTDKEGKTREIATHRNAFYRDDTGREIGGGTDRFKLVQPQVITGFFNDLIERFGFTIHKMGYCDHGSRIYVYASTDQHSWEVQQGDKTLNHLLIMTSFDGSTNTLIQPFVESLYCFNQLPMARNLFEPIKVSHSTNFDAKKVKLDLGIYGDACGKMRESLELMSRKRVTNKEALSMLYNTVKKADKIEDESSRTLNITRELFEKYLGTGMGANEVGRKGTVWGVLNAITERNTHEYGNNPNSRFRAITDGETFRATQNAYDYMNAVASEERDIEIVDLPLAV